MVVFKHEAVQFAFWDFLLAEIPVSEYASGKKGFVPSQQVVCSYKVCKAREHAWLSNPVLKNYITFFSTALFHLPGDPYRLFMLNFPKSLIPNVKSF